MRKIIVLLLVCLCFQGCSSDGDLASRDWESIESGAKGSMVRFYMDGANSKANAWFDGYVAEEVLKRFGITLVRVPIGANVVVPKLVAEKGSGGKGDIDLFLVDGGNFKAAREADVLYGPFAEKLPNFVRYVDKQMAATDFGYPVEGYEVPLGMTQFIFRYASDRVEKPPKTLLELQAWIKVNPGRFTYSAPPDPTGAAFVRQLFSTIVGGSKGRLSAWNEKLFQSESAKLWKFLEMIQPDLWQKGQRYPADVSEMDALFRSGELDICMSYGPPFGAAGPDGDIQGDSTRCFLIEGGTLSNMRFLAIPQDSPHKAGAMVVANFLLSPEAQYSKYLPKSWGDYPAINLDTLDRDQWDRFKTIELDDSLLPPDVLRKGAVPEMAPEYVQALNRGWGANVQ